MRWQTTAALAVVLIALGAFYYVYDVRWAPERETAAAAKGRVFSAEPADVVEIAVERPGGTVRFKREADGWQVLEPVRAGGDRGAVDELVTTVVTAKSDREIAAAPASVGEFGLDQPSAKVTLKLKSGKQLGLTLGAKSPTGAWVYAREADKTPVFVVGDSLLREATRPPADFRDKTLLAFDPKAVTGFEIVTGEGPIAVEGAEGKWKLARPVALDADTDTVREFLTKLQAGRVKEFVAESPPALAAYGLDRPLRVDLFTGKDKDRVTRSVSFGKLDEQKKGVYAMRPGESSVLLVPEDVWKAVPKTVATVRDKTVIAFDRDKVNRVEVDSPKGAVTLVRETDRWKITRPEPLPADQVEAGAILMKLRELRAQAFLSEDASGVAKFLAKPEVRVTLIEQDSPAPQTVLLAPSPERRGGQPSAYAGVAGRGPVVLVDGKVLAELSLSPADLRDRTVLPGLEPKNVKRVRVTAGPQSLTVERAGETDWKVVEPKRGSAKSARIEDLLYMLRGLRWKEIVAPDGQEPAKYGLEAPTLVVSLFRDDGKEIATVLFAKRDPDRVYLKTKAASAIYGIDARQVGDFPKVPDDLQG
jgi:uncharacterized protein DUF4340